MKLNEQWAYDDAADRLLIKETHDVQPVLDGVAALKSAGLTGTAERRHVGRVPFAVLENWVREAGVSFDDPEAVKEVMHRKLLSGEFSKFRIWEGEYSAANIKGR